MKLIITGASGSVGKKLIPILQERGVELLLVGRNLQNLEKIFPNLACVENSKLEGSVNGFDALLHLAILNNNKSGSDNDFRKANLDLLDSMFNIARKGDIKQFIYPSSIKIYEENTGDACNETKKKAYELLSQAEGPVITILHLPLVYGETFGGKLEFLNRLPSWLGMTIFRFYQCLKPTIHVNALADELIADFGNTSSESKIITDAQSGNWLYAAIKKMVDLVFALSIFILFWWFLIIIWLLIKFTSRGPGLFIQKRVGIHGKVFNCIKFRTMYVDTKDAPTNQVNASAVTKLGHILRRFKIDELPQIWNLLLGQMSLVGPRPCLPSQTELIEARKSQNVFNALPGITGWGQIHNIDMSVPSTLVDYDKQYVLLRTIVLDFKIIIRTFLGSGRGDNTAKR